MGTLIVFLISCYGVAGLGAKLTTPGLPWLATLRKPAFNPPDKVFGPVWTLLYTLMAFSGWLMMDAPATSAQRSLALTIFATQLALNLLWSLLFFYLRRPAWALVDVVLLLITIWSYVAVVWRVNTVAAALFIPYGLWVAFATILNASIWRLNAQRPESQ